MAHSVTYGFNHRLISTIPTSDAKMPSAVGTAHIDNPVTILQTRHYSKKTFLTELD
ncbi:hypothetical protein [Roseimarinus sediminis]|uniref:hypothetical protein n=1 Tax=Roseimarinus sediminis TaxID=1610899 RepID=UPI003D25727B